MTGKLPKALRRAGGEAVKRAASRDTRCGACAGSGFYDDTDSRGRPIPCGACDGTGLAGEVQPNG